MSQRDNSKLPVLVTGASKGIGRGIALRLGAAGHPVSVHFGADRAGAEATANAIIGAGAADARV